MAKTNVKSVDEYLAGLPELTQSILSLVRSTIRKAVPAAEEAIAYQIPAYKLPGGPLLFFAGWKKHYSLYPASETMAIAFKEELLPYSISKGTIRFPLSQPVPVALIARIAKFRAKEIAEQRKAKPPAPRKR